jgi:serine phosphatase RsbU (regulator of sigma subunit)/class 3 adenylate cyclase
MNCGASLSLVCANCHADLPLKAHFCIQCGQPVSASTDEDAASLSRLTSSTPQKLARKVRAFNHLAGERRTVTGLFADVVDSTSAIAKIGREQYSDFILKVFNRFLPIIYRYEGTIAFTQNDTLLAFFGAPIAHEDDPMRAVRTAFDLLAFTADIDREARDVLGIPFKIRVGISTGPVSLSAVDSDLRYQFTPLGPEINLASHIQITAEPMSVILSEDTYHLVAPYIHAHPLDTVLVEGRHEPVQTYKITRLVEHSEQIRGLAGLTSPMVGRQAELAALLQLSEAAHAGLGRAALVLGEPGIGKTRLINEWRTIDQNAGFEPSMLWIRGRSLSYERSLPYQLLIDCVQSLIQLSPQTNETDSEASLLNLVESLVDDPHEIYPYLAHLLSIDLKDDDLEQVHHLDPQALQAQYLSSLRILLRGLTESHPVAIILEDLHWADPSSIELLIKLLPLATNTPLLFCLVSRPDRDSPGWKLVIAANEILGESLTRIRLAPLSDDESKQLLGHLLKEDTLSERMRKKILVRSEGNPFFVEELIRTLIAQGAIQRTNGGWSAGSELGHMTIPNSLEALLQAHLDRLPAEARNTLRVASVIGRQFQIPLLKQIVEKDSVLDDINTLEMAGLVRVIHIKPELTYAFRHTLQYEATYASLLPDDRRELHRLVGEAMEVLCTNQIDELAPRLARHFSEAGNQLRALEYYQMAGNHALGSYATQEAESHFRHALAHSDTPHKTAALLDRLGETLFEQGHYAQAIETWNSCIQIYQEMGSNEQIARLYARSARAAWLTGDTPACLVYCLDGLQAVDLDIESPGLAALLHETGRAYYFNGEMETSIPYIQRALSMAERFENVEVQADTLATLGLLSNQSPEQVISALTRAVELAESHNLLAIGARAHTNLGSAIISLRGDLRKARAHFWRAAELQHQRGAVIEEMQARLGVAEVSFNLGELASVEETLNSLEKLLVQYTGTDTGSAILSLRIFEAQLMASRGEWGKALPLLQTYREEASERGNLHFLADVCRSIGWVVMEMYTWNQIDSTDEAYEAFQQALEIADKGLKIEVSLLCLFAMLCVLRKDYDQAEALLQQARQKTTPNPIPLEESWLLWAEAFYATHLARWEQAFQAYEQAVGKIIPTGLRWHWARLLKDWAEALRHHGEPQDLDRARLLLQQSQSLFIELGAPEYAHRVENRLQQITSETQARAADHHKVSRELDMAGRVQGGLLPVALPQIAGWQFSARLRPARQTSGDYYDFITLPNGHIGILVGDVADKGMGAALFMTLSRTLIRTYAFNYPTQPAEVYRAANQRMHEDSQFSLFVTSFYGILDPIHGSLVYSNAGHNPPYWAQPHSNGEIQPLVRTGIPLGIFEYTYWDTATIQLHPGDLVVMFTDGLTEAENSNGEFYGEERLIASIQKHTTSIQSTEEMMELLLADLHAFTGEQLNTDDLALVMIYREP